MRAVIKETLETPIKNRKYFNIHLRARKKKIRDVVNDYIMQRSNDATKNRVSGFQVRLYSKPGGRLADMWTYSPTYSDK